MKLSAANMIMYKNQHTAQPVSLMQYTIKHDNTSLYLPSFTRYFGLLAEERSYRDQGNDQ